MDHRTIDSENIAERYVAGRLAPETAAAFEEHYLECADCCLRVETAERMERGLRRLADREVRPAPAPRRVEPVGWPLRRPMQWGLAAAAGLALALVPLGWQMRTVRDLRAELQTTRDRLAQAERAEPDAPGARLPEPTASRLTELEGELSEARRDLAAAGEERQALVAQVAEAERPRGDLPILPLASSRGGADPAQPPTLKLPKEPGLVALWVEPGDGGFPRYDVVLKNSAGTAVVKISGLALNDLGALLVTVHSASLPPGAYRLEIDGRPPGGKSVPVDRFELRVAAPR